MRHLVSLLAVALLAGCGTTHAASVRMAAPMAARVNTSTHAALVTVPASVMDYADDHYHQLAREHNRSSDRLSATVTLVASKDHFKHDRHEAQLDPKSFPGSGAREFMLGMVNADIAPGEYEYYLVVRGMVAHVVTGSVTFDTLEDFYVSDYGKNYRTTIK